jgi:hypothetical protein
VTYDVILNAAKNPEKAQRRDPFSALRVTAPGTRQSYAKVSSDKNTIRRVVFFYRGAASRATFRAYVLVLVALGEHQQQTLAHFYCPIALRAEQQTRLEAFKCRLSIRCHDAKAIARLGNCRCRLSQKEAVCGARVSRSGKREEI